MDSSKSDDLEYIKEYGEYHDANSYFIPVVPRMVTDDHKELRMWVECSEHEGCEIKLKFYVDTRIQVDKAGQTDGIDSIVGFLRQNGFASYRDLLKIFLYRLRLAWQIARLIIDQGSIREDRVYIFTQATAKKMGETLLTAVERLEKLNK
jgi:hypothetical protein